RRGSGARPGAVVVPLRAGGVRRLSGGDRPALRGRFAQARHGRVAAPARTRRNSQALRIVTDLSHVTESGSVRMVDVGGKPLSRRRAVARATVRMAAETARRLRELPKGDALTTAQIAGIQAAKRTGELIPLCHPLALTNVSVELAVAGAAVEIVA